MRDQIKAIIQEVGFENLTAKSVREKLEEAQGLEAGALKKQKAEISRIIDEVLDELEPQDDGVGGDAADDAADDDEEEEAAPPPKKKAKASPATAAPSDEPMPEKNHSCKTRSGAEAPKDLKKVQGKMKMTAAKFLNSAPPIKIDICGNILTGHPREFSSGSKGWYLGGKIEIPLGKGVVWAQAGLNITIPGSQEWS